MLLDNGEPANYEEAMMSPDSDKWLEAMKSEIGSMYEKKVLEICPRGNNKMVIIIFPCS